MKILLVGEYSGLHNTLKEGLQALGHQVTLIATGDGFKNYPADILLKKAFVSGWKKTLKVLIYKVSGFDIGSYVLYQRFKAQTPNLKGFDVVQLINESPFTIQPYYEKKCIRFLKNNNQKLFLLSCGADYSSVSYDFNKVRPYSILSPYFNKKVSRKKYAPILKYLRPSYIKLHQYILKHCNGVLASDLDYHLPLQTNPKYLGLHPNPINSHLFKVEPFNDFTPIIIFHGINRSNYFKKGSDFFEAALKIIAARYPNKVKVVQVEDVPYAKYITLYKDAHILLDQVFAYDQGYNALEAMVQGKVVFTGADSLFYEHYNLTHKIAINALPDVKTLVAELDFLIQNPNTIKTIGKHARDFVLKHHDHEKVAAQYLASWQAN